MGEIGIKPESWTSPAGITVIYQEIAHTHEIYTKIFVRAGQFHDPLYKPGIAHMVEHLVIDGMPNPDGRTIYKAHDQGSMLDYLNGTTGITNTHYNYRFFGDEAETRAGAYLKDILWVMQNPHLEGKALQREKNRLAHELGLRRNAPDQRLYDSMKDHLIGLGTSGPFDQDVLFDITADDIYDFMKAYYRPENIVVCISGKEMDYKSIFTGNVRDVKSDVLLPRTLSLTGTFNHHIANTGYGAQHFLLGYKIPNGDEHNRLRAALLSYSRYEYNFSDISLFSDLYTTPKVWEIEGPDSVWHTLYGSKPERSDICYQQDMQKHIRALCTEERLDAAKNNIVFFNGTYVSTDTVAERLGEHYLATGDLLDYDDYTRKVNQVTFEDFSAWIEGAIHKPDIVITA